MICKFCENFVAKSELRNNDSQSNFGSNFRKQKINFGHNIDAPGSESEIVPNEKTINYMRLKILANSTAIDHILDQCCHLQSD